jgi:hypothetical protein
MVKRRLHLGRIENELRDLQRYFPAINAMLKCRRDDFTDTVRQNMIAAYEFLDALVKDDVDLFSEGLGGLLQLNYLVLLGRGYDAGEFSRHITATRQQFFDNFRRYVKPIRRWYRRHELENPYKVAAQVYVGVLSQPQLYQEGNHRTGSLIAIEDAAIMQTEEHAARGQPELVIVDHCDICASKPVEFLFRGCLRQPDVSVELKQPLQDAVEAVHRHPQNVLICRRFCVLHACSPTMPWS